MAGFEKPREGSHLVVAAFDFGTTFSGYAFSYRHDPQKIITNHEWISGTGTLMSHKTPTCILLDPEEKFHSFGFEAENKYHELVEDNEQEGWLFFRRFKMLLYDNKKLSVNSTVKDINGKRLLAMDVFSLAIRFLQYHLLSAIKKQKPEIEETDIIYVLTIPAIWDNSGKQFMRMAAIQADINPKRLKLALEPEAASIWCHTLSEETKTSLSKPGAKYMVVDLGGGTADITVHKRRKNGTLKELHVPSGGPWGGMYVDNYFLAWLDQLCGQEAMHRFKTECMAGYFEMLREFEINKRTVSLDKTKFLSIRIPAELREISEKENGKTLKEIVSSSKVEIKRDKIRVDSSDVSKWFENQVNNIVSHMKVILKKTKMEAVSSILLVGGFGESLYVQEKIKNAFADKHLIVPDDAGLTVLKGAVIFGHQPSTISSRIMKFSYGISSYKPISESEDCPTYILIIDGTIMVDNSFSVFVKAGQSLRVGHKCRKNLSPTAENMTQLSVFRTSDTNPVYTTDPGCECVGMLEVKHPGPEKLEDKELEVTMIFGDTELSVKAKIIKTGQKCSTTIDCLNE